MAGGVSSGVATAAAVPGGLQNMASIELGKKRMRDTNDDLLMVPPLLHDNLHYPLVELSLFYLFFSFRLYLRFQPKVTLHAISRTKRHMKRAPQAPYVPRLSKYGPMSL
uniref:Uncharacterized protein n=1 Tax=Bracon brevicornis TaxID=1563983 RepID=A0A6V7L0N8_9HYME